jgi:regulatory protein
MAWFAVAFFIMGKITAINKQKRNPNRVSVFIDDEFAFGLALIKAVRQKIGQTLTSADIEALQKDDQSENAKQAAITFIEYRPRSISEVRQRLHKKGYDDDTIEKALSRLQEINLLNDVEFTNYWVEQRQTFKPRSQMALRQELLQKGVDRTIIDEIISDIDEEAAAKRAAEKQMNRWRNLPEEQFKQKAMAYLQRRGFQYMIVKETIDEIWQEHSSQQQT